VVDDADVTPQHLTKRKAEKYIMSRSTNTIMASVALATPVLFVRANELSPAWQVAWAVVVLANLFGGLALWALDRR